MIDTGGDHARVPVTVFLTDIRRNKDEYMEIQGGKVFFPGNGFYDAVSNLF